MLGLPPARFDSADANTLDNKIALYQLNVCLGHPCKVIEKKSLKLLLENGELKFFCAYWPKKKRNVYLNNEKMSPVQYLDIKCLQLLNIVFIQGRFKNPCLPNLKGDVSTAVGSEWDISTTLKYSWWYIFHADWSIRITAGHINGEKQPLQQQADEKLIMFSCLTLLTMSEGN